MSGKHLENFKMPSSALTVPPHFFLISPKGNFSAPFLIIEPLIPNYCYKGESGITAGLLESGANWPKKKIEKSVFLRTFLVASHQDPPLSFPLPIKEVK